MRFDPPAGTEASRAATREYHRAWKAFGNKPIVINRKDNPALWDDWRAYYYAKNIDLPLVIMDEPGREYHTVPSYSPMEFEPSFDLDAHKPPKLQRPNEPDYGTTLARAAKALSARSPESKARVDELMRKFNAGIPVNDEVARFWARMEPVWQSHNPAYAGQTKTPEQPPKRSDEQRLADLAAHANEPLVITPALEKALKLKADMETQGDPT